MNQELYELAVNARLLAYTPYSHFKVGAVVVGHSGKRYTGCNIENAAFGSTMCAERTAIFKGISEGESGFDQIVVTGQTDGPIAPCGACRQVIAEFFAQNASVTLTNLTGDYEELTVAQLLPGSFTRKDLEHDN